MLTLSCTSSSSSVSSHWDSLLVLLNVLQELDCALEFPSLDDSAGLTGVLEGNTEVASTGTSRLRRREFCCSVSDLDRSILVSVCTTIVCNKTLHPSLQPNQLFLYPSHMRPCHASLPHSNSHRCRCCDSRYCYFFFHPPCLSTPRSTSSSNTLKRSAE